MIYVMDTNSFVIMSHFFPERFPSFWARLDEVVVGGRLVSVKEVFREITRKNARPHLDNWVKKNKKIFRTPTEEEALFVARIFQHEHFMQTVKKRQLLQGTPVADPFIVAAAKALNGCVVTEEVYKPNSAKLPNICEKFEVPYINLDQFLGEEGFRF